MATERATSWRANLPPVAAHDGPQRWGVATWTGARRMAVHAMSLLARGRWLERLFSVAFYAVACLLAGAAFAAPLVMPSRIAGSAWLGPGGASGLLTLVVCWSLAALLFEAGSTRLGLRAIAALGVLVATNSLLRFAETVLPGPGGFSPIFALILLAGYAYGMRFGFLMGALTMLVSALVTGGVGPWLPYQMLAAGWVGLSAGLVPRRGTGHRWRPEAREVAVLAALGALWGFGYGLIMTLWFWPFLEGASGRVLPASAPSFGRFAAFYVASSLTWDAFAAAGNVLLIGVLGAPVLAVLRRFGRRFAFASAPSPARTSDPVRREVEATAGFMAGPCGGEREAAELAEERLLAQLDGSMAGQIQPRAWLSCLAAVAALVSVSRHPLLLLAAAASVWVLRHQLGPRDSASHRLVAIAGLALALPTLYNGLVSHAGQTIVARLPAAWPLVGGPITLEALVFGLLSGLSLWTLLLAFATLLAAMPQRELVRLLPRGFGGVTLAVAVALGYVPLVRRQAQAVREAQAVRGYELRGVRDWPPLMIPLLVGALESGMTMAESLAARGALRPLRVAGHHRLLILVGLVLVLAGLLSPWPAAVADPVAPAATLLGVGLMTGVLVALGRSRPRTALRPGGWRWCDRLVAGAPWLPLIVAFLHPSGRAALRYTPYPVLAWPTLPVAVLASLIGLVAPVLVLGLLGRRSRCGSRDGGPAFVSRRGEPLADGRAM